MCEEASKIGEKEGENRKARGLDNTIKRMGGNQIWEKVFTPSFYKMKDIHGRPVTLNKKADALAEYLEKVHWAQVIEQPEEKIDETMIFRHSPPIEAGSIIYCRRSSTDCEDTEGKQSSWTRWNCYWTL